MNKLYGDIIVDIAAQRLDKSFQYEIPDELKGSIKEGSKVLIPFGASDTLREGYVISLGSELKISPEKIKKIDSIVPFSVSPKESLMELAGWIKEIYGSTYIVALKTVLPAKTLRKRKRKNDSESCDNPPAQFSVPKLTQEQYKIYGAIKDSFEREKKPCLLEGITGSGKTNIYMSLIQDTIREGKSAILLIPEISLTWQTLSRFTEAFGNRVGVMHSRLTPAQKGDLVEKIEEGEVSLVIGPRSALFAPLSQIGIIIIDEEHDVSYQSEKTPKYSAIDVAIKRAELSGANLLLGSATPSLGSRYMCDLGKYRLFKLQKRYGNAIMPAIEIVDMREEAKAGNKSLFSVRLLEEIDKRLEKGEQSILFLNRRGINGTVSCSSCGKPIKCPHCDVSLTLHRGNIFKCHYCGYTMPMVEKCPECGSKFLRGVNVGTQQVESNLMKIFPKARIIRMDRDSVKKKDAYENILHGFKERKGDILLGTQMVVKGHDFSGVTLTAVLSADMSLYEADYRANERTFQTLVQVSGRSGRGEIKGLGLIQTYNPEHYAIVHSITGDYEAFYREELENRKIMEYPPIGSLLKISGAGKDKKILRNAMRHVASFVESINKMGYIVLGPTSSSISKIADMYQDQIFVKGGDRDIIIKIRRITEEYVNINRGFKDITVQFSLNE